MSFNLQSFSKVSVSGNHLGVNHYTYNGLEPPVQDNISTILTPGYFNKIVYFKNKDIIYIRATDATIFVEVVDISEPLLEVKQLTFGAKSNIIDQRFFVATTGVLTQIVPIPGVISTDIVLASLHIPISVPTLQIVGTAAGTNDVSVEFTILPLFADHFSLIVVRLI